MIHGTCSTYINHGCRCAECKAANTQYCRQRTMARSVLLDELPDEKHGLASTYGNWRCRCDRCRHAAVAAVAARKRKRAKT